MPPLIWFETSNWLCSKPNKCWNKTITRMTSFSRQVTGFLTALGVFAPKQYPLQIEIYFNGTLPKIKKTDQGPNCSRRRCDSSWQHRKTKLLLSLTSKYQFTLNLKPKHIESPFWSLQTYFYLFNLHLIKSRISYKLRCRICALYSFNFVPWCLPFVLSRDSKANYYTFFMAI